MIQFEQVSLRRGGRVLFQKASMQLHPGWKIGLTGVNGAGKSTLFNAITKQNILAAEEAKRNARKEN